MGMRIQPLAAFLVVMFMWSGLAGCGGGGGGEVAPPPPTPSGVGSVSGRLNVEGVVSLGQARLAAASKQSVESSLAEGGNVEPDFVPGEIIVRFKPEISEPDAIARLVKAYADVKLESRGLRYPGGSYIFITDAYENEQLSKKEAQERTRSVLERLKADPAVRYTELNAIAQAQVVPTDLFFTAGFQWNLRAIGLPAAWELTTGSPEVVVAVLDSGISKGHPELAPLLLPGYDFVSNLIDAGDLNGIDPDPEEPAFSQTKFHGTHVAGTIAAASNNRKGVAGVAWNVRLMPIRVINVFDKVNNDDLINGMLYAAGLPNTSNTIPTRPAQIINMSLGGKGLCSLLPDIQNVIDVIRAQGISIVVAAGNEAEFDPSTGLTNPITIPASCRGVMAVGAVTSQLEHASYSTHHPYVFIAAPGGTIRRTPIEGILSTIKVSGNNTPQYQFLDGTSMAAPHVAGVIALMRSVNPSLTPDAIEQILKETARDDSHFPGKDEFFGYGVVRANLAVAAAAGTPPPSVPIPYAQPSLVIFDSASGTKDVSVSNQGLGTLHLTDLRVSDASASWLAAELLNDNAIRITVNGTGLTADSYLGVIAANSNGGGLLFVPVVMRLPFQGLPDLGQITVVLEGLDLATGQPVKRTTTTDRTQGFAYSFPSVEPGQYLVLAGSDKDGNGQFGDGVDETIGLFPFIGGRKPITVEAGKETRNIDFPIIKGETIITTDK